MLGDQCTNGGRECYTNEKSIPNLRATNSKDYIIDYFVIGPIREVAKKQVLQY